MDNTGRVNCGGNRDSKASLVANIVRGRLDELLAEMSGNIYDLEMAISSAEDAVGILRESQDAALKCGSRTIYDLVNPLNSRIVDATERLKGIISLYRDQVGDITLR